LLERGGRSPTLKTPSRLAEHLGVKPSDILRRVESKVAGTGKKGGATPSP
jgi:DNA-binding MarR family transcriptional regulator